MVALKIEEAGDLVELRFIIEMVYLIVRILCFPRLFHEEVTDYIAAASKIVIASVSEEVEALE